MADFFKSYENVLIKVFLHAVFISALKTEPKSMVLRNMQKMENIIYYHYFLYFEIFV